MCLLISCFFVLEHKGQINWICSCLGVFSSACVRVSEMLMQVWCVCSVWHWGQVSVYGSAGFVQDLSRTMQDSRALIKQLNTHQWLDPLWVSSHTHWYIQPMHTNQLVRRQTRNKRLKKWFYIDYLLHTHLHFYRPFRKLIKSISSNISWINVLKNNSWLLKTELKLYYHYQSWNECLVEITLHSFIIARLPKYLFNIFS